MSGTHNCQSANTPHTEKQPSLAMPKQLPSSTNKSNRSTNNKHKDDQVKTSIAEDPHVVGSDSETSEGEDATACDSEPNERTQLDSRPRPNTDQQVAPHANPSAPSPVSVIDLTNDSDDDQDKQPPPTPKEKNAWGCLVFKILRARSVKDATLVREPMSPEEEAAVEEAQKMGMSVQDIKEDFGRDEWEQDQVQKKVRRRKLREKGNDASRPLCLSDSEGD